MGSQHVCKCSEDMAGLSDADSKISIGTGRLAMAGMAEQEQFLYSADFTRWN